MKDKKERLADAELDIMRVLWKNGAPMKASEITKALAGERSWKTQTAHVILGRLCDKGCIAADKSTYSHTFSAALTEEEYFAAESSILLERMGNSVTGLVASLIDTDSVSDAEIEELEALIRARRERKDGTK